MISTLAIGGLTLGSLSSGSGYIFEKHDGFDFPKVRIDVRDRGQYHGAKLGSYNYGRRIFVVDGMIYADSESDFETKRRDLQEAVDIDSGLQTMTITTRSGLTLQSSVIVNSELDTPYEKGKKIFCPFRLEMVAPFPYIEEDTATSTTVTPVAGGGGAVPSAIPFSLATGGGSATTITNNGNAKAFPTITIYGRIENPSLRNETTGKTLSLTYTLSSSTDYIVLDFYNRTALLNGSTNVLQYVTGDWWTLASGANSIKLTSASYSASAEAVVSHRDAYLGI